jgi:hypothetical protein
MKRTKQCPKCESLRIGYLVSQIDANDLVVKPDSRKLSPHVPVTMHHEQVAPRMLGVSKEVIKTGALTYGDVSQLIGRLEAYVCTECGYHESYVQDPSAVRWTDIVGFSWVNEPAESEGIYR